MILDSFHFSCWVIFPSRIKWSNEMDTPRKRKSSAVAPEVVRLLCWLACLPWIMPPKLLNKSMIHELLPWKPPVMCASTLWPWQSFCNNIGKAGMTIDLKCHGQKICPPHFMFYAIGQSSQRRRIGHDDEWMHSWSEYWLWHSFLIISIFKSGKNMRKATATMDCNWLCPLAPESSNLGTLSRARCKRDGETRRRSSRTMRVSQKRWGLLVLPLLP